jgi:hypothetical protein
LQKEGTKSKKKNKKKTSQGSKTLLYVAGAVAVMGLAAYVGVQVLKRKKVQ